MSNTSISKQAFRLLLCVTLVGVCVAPKAFADGWDKQTKITFSEDVQIPGRVLPAGTYTFRLLDSPSDRHVVQIFDENNQKLITTVLAIPDRMTKPRGRTIVNFEERPAGQPVALKEWFYPGDEFGQEFVYPKGGAYAKADTTSTVTETAVATPAPTPAPEPTPVAVVETPAPVAAPESQPVQDTTPIVATPAPEPAPVVTAPDPTPAPATMPDNDQQLPKTGSEMPLIAALGSSAFGIGALLRSLRRRS